MMQSISIEQFADMVMKHNKGYQKRTGKDTQGNAYRKEKRRKMDDLRSADLGGGERHHRQQPLLYLYHRRSG